MARQLGLGVSRIVIDPGHGGHDPGATGKGVTRSGAGARHRAAAREAAREGAGVEVVLTRRTDEFVPLQERTAIANREGADLFLSIHANASANDQARGVETYFLNFANNLSAARGGGARERRVGPGDGCAARFRQSDRAEQQARRVARLRHATCSARWSSGCARQTTGVKDLGVKQAPFVVLIGASMPSVLAEMSFLTNAAGSEAAEDAARYRQRIAEALFDAIRKYQTSLRTRTPSARSS